MVATAFVDRVGITGSEVSPCYGNQPNYVLFLLFTSSSYIQMRLLKGRIVLEIVVNFKTT